ncbi:hypothetical protein ACFS07_31640 [Undibacterium arcticum]
MQANANRRQILGAIDGACLIDCAREPVEDRAYTDEEVKKSRSNSFYASIKVVKKKIAGKVKCAELDRAVASSSAECSEALDHAGTKRISGNLAMASNATSPAA